jgi:hypothetical protein
MKNVSGRPAYLVDVKVALGRLCSVGLTIPADVRRHCLTSYEINRSGIYYERDAPTRVVFWLADEKRASFLASATWLIPAARDVCRSLLHHWISATNNETEQLDFLALVARRYLLGLAHFGEVLSIPDLFDRFTEECCLPDPNTGFDRVVMEPRMPATIQEAERGTHQLFDVGGRTDDNAELIESADEAFASHCFVHKDGGVSIVETGKQPDPRSYPEETAATATLGMQANSELLGYRLLRMILQPSLQSVIPARFQLAFLIQLFYGIAPKDVGAVGILEWGPLGKLTKTHLLLSLGTPYFPCAHNCYNSSTLPLPLVPELKDLLHRHPEILREKSLAEVLGPRFQLEYQSWCKSFALKQFGPGMVNTQSFHRIWLRVSILDLDQSPALVGLSRGNPLPGIGGPPFYTMASTHEMLGANQLREAQIRGNAGYCTTAAGPIESSRPKQHGTPSLSYGEYADRLWREVDLASSHNAVLACLEGFVRLFGPRNLGQPMNPLLFYRLMNFPCFEFCDKIVNGVGHYRWKPLPDESVPLLKSCGRLGKHLLLPFCHKGLLVRFSHLPDAARLREVFTWPGARQPARTAFCNLLRHEGVGQYLVNSLTGHGNPMFQGLGHLGLLSLDEEIAWAHEILSPIYRKHGVGEIANCLREKMELYIDAEFCAKADPLLLPDETSHQRRGDITDNPFRHGLRPPSEAERYRSHLSERPPEQTTFGVSKVSFAILMAVVLALPVENLIEYRRYYRAENFVQDRVSGRVYFRALSRHDDRGQLSDILVLVCEASAIATHPLLQLFFRLFGECLPSALLFPDDMSPDDLGTTYKHSLVIPGHRNTLSNAETYRLLKKNTRFLCRRRHPGPVLFALVGKGKRGLNRVASEDIIQLQTGKIPDLVCLVDQSPYRSCLSQTPQQVAAADKLLIQKIKKVHGRPFGAEGISRLKTLLHACRFVPSTYQLEKVLKIWGYSKPEAERHAGTLMSYCRKAGLFCLTEPLRLLTIEERQDLKSKLGGSRSRYRDIALILEACGARIGELSADSSFHLFSEAGRCFIYIGGGKNSNAKRWIDLHRFLPETDIRELVKNLTQYAKKPGHIEIDFPASPKTASRGVDRLLAGLSKKRIGAHDLRHQFFFHVTQRLINESLRSGNFISRLCALATVGGHGSVSVAIRAYIGTGIMALCRLGWVLAARTHSTREAEVALMGYRLRFPTLREAESRVRMEISGEAAYASRVQGQRRAMRFRILALPKKNADSRPLVRLINPEKYAEFVDDKLDYFELSLPNPPFGWERHWEQAVLELMDLSLQRNHWALIPLYSDRAPFINRLKVCGRKHRARVVEEAI